jgi:RNA polymerase sigma-54 factor
MRVALDLPPPTAAHRQLADALGVPVAELHHAIRHLVEANVDLAPLLDVPPERAAAWSREYLPPTAPLPAPDRDTLLHQLIDSDPSPATRLVARTLLHHVGEDGLLTGTIAAIARACHTHDERVEQLRRRLRLLAPVGTGCRTRAEQLELRVRDAWPDDPRFPLLVRRRLTALETGRYEEPAATMGLEVEEFAAYARRLGTLPARPPLPPARSGRVPAVVYTIAHDRAGFWRVVGESGQADPLRRQVVDLAIFRQRAFLHDGPDHLRPFALSDIARVLRRDLSTVSRVLPGVVLHSKGVEHPVRSLFALPMVGSDFTVAQLTSQLRRIIAQEDPTAPWADATLAELLSAGGMRITRRSVQKHRERLRIPAARDRRR